MKAARFVGGPADGKTYAFPDKPPFWFKVATYHWDYNWWDRDDLMADTNINYSVYRLWELPGETQNFLVYTPDDWTLDRLLSHLLYYNSKVENIG